MSEPRLIDQYLRVAEAAKELGISRATLLKLCRARQIAHIELCGRYVFRREDLASFIESRRSGVATDPKPEPYRLKHLA